MKKIEISEECVKNIERILSKYSSYDVFTQTQNRKDAFEVASLYNVRICPYCNINYAYTVEEDLTCRPDFDHFEMKSVATGRQLIWDNLIPCCQQCNSRIKLRIPFSRKTHLHPIYDDFDSLVEFIVDIKSVGNIMDKNNFSIKCNTCNTRAKNSIRDLKIRQRYSFHKDVVQRIIKNGYINNRYRLSEIGSMLKMKSLDDKDDSLENDFEKALVIQRLLFPDVDCDISKTSLGKLKRDVSKKLRKWSSEK